MRTLGIRTRCIVVRTICSWQVGSAHTTNKGIMSVLSKASKNALRQELVNYLVLLSVALWAYLVSLSDITWGLYVINH